MDTKERFDVWSLGEDGPQKCLATFGDVAEALEYAADHQNASGFGCGVRDCSTGDWCLDEDWISAEEAFGPDEAKYW